MTIYSKVTLREHVVTHCFSDKSGTVFFNTVSGETIGLALSKADLEQLLLTGELLDELDVESSKLLANVLSFH